MHFVSNMDGTQLDSLFKILNPQTTLFIISSKSFPTIDTLSNAKTAMSWLLASHDNKATILRRHFIGISTKADKMSEWGTMSITNHTPGIGLGSISMVSD